MYWLFLFNLLPQNSKLRAGKIALHSDCFTVSDVLEDVCEILGTLATSKRIDLGYLVREGVPDVVVGDLGKLRQVLLNLIGT